MRYFSLLVLVFLCSLIINAQEKNIDKRLIDAIKIKYEAQIEKLEAEKILLKIKLENDFQKKNSLLEKDNNKYKIQLEDITKENRELKEENMKLKEEITELEKKLISSEPVLEDTAADINESVENVIEHKKISGLVDINKADIKEIEQIPGIDFSTASNIIWYRNLAGYFKVKEDILNVPGIDAEIFKKIKDKIIIEK